MAIVTRQFEQVANIVTERIAELLCARVLVLDDRGVPIAQSAGYGNANNQLGFNESFKFSVLSAKYSSSHLKRSRIQNPLALRPDFRIPIRCAGRCGEVIITASEEGETISPRLAQMLVEMIVNQTTAVAQLPNQHELKNKFIHDLLCGAIANEADILRQAQILGMDFTRPRAVILIDGSDFILASGKIQGFEVGVADHRAQLIINSIVNFFHLPSDTICAYIGNGEVAVLKASSTQDLVLWAEREDKASQSNPSWANLAALKRASCALLTRLRCDTNASISIGIGRYHPGIQGLAKSYQDARTALSLGRRLPGHNQVHCLDGLGIAAFVGISDESTKIELANHLLSPLDQEPNLLETLDAFFRENCCPSSTAKRLSIHRNTLSYRLDKIALLTGLDPRRFDDAMQIRLAILLGALLY